MEYIKPIIVSAAVALLVCIAAFQLAPGSVQTVVKEKLGAMSGPDIASPYFSFGGVRHWGARIETLNTATTTVCALQSPAATSTLLEGSIKLTTSSTTASRITLARAATAFATTTLLGSVDVAAGAQASLVASSTPTTQGADVFPPSTYFVVGMQGNVGTFSPVGSCNATWLEL